MLAVGGILRMQLSIAPSLETAVTHFWGTSRIVQQAVKPKEVQPIRKPRNYPFYVGKGSGKRVAVRHLASCGTKPAICELSHNVAQELGEELIADHLAQGCRQPTAAPF